MKIKESSLKVKKEVEPSVKFIKAMFASTQCTENKTLYIFMTTQKFKIHCYKK